MSRVTRTTREPSSTTRFSGEGYNSDSSAAAPPPSDLSDGGRRSSTTQIVREKLRQHSESNLEYDKACYLHTKEFVHAYSGFFKYHLLPTLGITEAQWTQMVRPPSCLAVSPLSSCASSSLGAQQCCEGAPSLCNSVALCVSGTGRRLALPRTPRLCTRHLASGSPPCCGKLSTPPDIGSSSPSSQSWAARPPRLSHISRRDALGKLARMLGSCMRHWVLTLVYSVTRECSSFATRSWSAQSPPLS